MAKRAPVDQKPFTALDKGLAASVMNPPATVTDDTLEAATQPSEAQTPAERQPDKVEAVQVPQRRPEASPAAATSAVIARRPIVAPRSGTNDTPVEKLSREKRVLLTPSEEREIERCVDRIAEGFGGTPVKLSHIVRACLAVVRHAEGQIIRRAQDVGQLNRPPNGDLLASAEFEHEIAKVLSNAFRDTPPLR